MCVWIIACTDALTASALDFGQTVRGPQRCVTAHIVLMASMQPRPKEDIKRATEDQATRPSHEMNCTACQKNYARSFSLYVAQFQSLLINDGTETA